MKQTQPQKNAAVQASPAGPAALPNRCSSPPRLPGNQAMQSLLGNAAISQPGDASERQADVAAQRVLAGLPPGLPPPPGGQRPAPGLPPVVRQALRSPGQPLDGGLRSRMEAGFQADFSRVNIHTGADAQASARALQARAYTTGQDIVFGRGGFDPGSPQGRQVLAHELAHVVQQQGGLAAPGAIQRWEDESLAARHEWQESMAEDRAREEALHERWEGSHQERFSTDVPSQARTIADDIQRTEMVLASQRSTVFNRLLETSREQAAQPADPLLAAMGMGSSGPAMIPENLMQEWGRARLAVETVATFAGMDEIPPESADQARSAFTGYYAAFIPLAESNEQHNSELEARFNFRVEPASRPQIECRANLCHQPQDMAPEPLRYLAPAPISPSLREHLSTAVSAADQSGWAQVLTNFRYATREMDKIFLEMLPVGTEGYDSFRYTQELLTRQETFQEHHPFSMRIPAVFYPKDEFIDVTTEDGSREQVAKGIPWLFYLYHSGYDQPGENDPNGEWVLKDITSPLQSEERTNTEDPRLLDAFFLGQGIMPDPPVALFEQLNTALRFPEGQLYWTMPSGQGWTLETTEPWTLSGFLTAVGIGLAALGLILLTAGAGTPAAIALAGAAAVGVGSTLADWQERSEQGMLTDADISRGALSIAADLASIASGGLGKIASIAATTGRLGRLGALAGRYYMVVESGSRALDAVNILVMTNDYVEQMEAINTMPGLTDEERDRARQRLYRTGLMTAAMMSAPVVMGRFRPGQGESLRLGVDSDGNLHASGAPNGMPRPPVEDAAFLQASRDLPSADLTNEQLSRELGLAQQSTARRPLSDGSEYVEEVPLEGGRHSWKRHRDGYWCRFSDEALCLLLGDSPETGGMHTTGFSGAGIRNEEARRAREVLRGGMGTPPAPRVWQAHHIIPYEMRNHPIIYEITSRFGWNINAPGNGIYLPESAAVRGARTESIHFGSHPAYNSWIEDRLNIIQHQWSTGIIPDSQLVSAVDGLVAEFYLRLATGQIRLRTTVTF